MVVMKVVFLAILVFLMGGPPVLAQVTEEELVREAEERNSQDSQKPAGIEEAKADPEKGEGDLGDEPYKIVIRADIELSYVFAESPDSFLIKYKLNMEGAVRNKVDVIKGKGLVQTEVQGFLAKWPTGECKLMVSIGEIPFELIFTKMTEELVLLNVNYAEEILEKLESNCTFLDAPGAKFNTSGNPEKWLETAMGKNSYRFKNLKIPIDRLHRETTTLTFEPQRFLVADPPLGSAEIEFKGTIQIIPER